MKNANKSTTHPLTRNKETMEAYSRKRATSKENEEEIFARLQKEAIKSFKHWFLVENDFPYDAIAKTHHILFPKRKVPFNWECLNKKELEEFAKIKKGYLSETYEVLWENLPKGRSVKSILHIHLLNMIRK